METDQVLNQDCLPYLASMPNESVDVVITDPPYPSGAGLFADSLIDGIAALYLCAKKAKKHVVFFWSPLVDVPKAPPGWFHTATHIWEKPDCKTSIRYELIIAWSRDYKRQPHKVWTVPILDYRTLKDWNKMHPTQKPVRLMRYIIEDYTQPGDVVLDPFGGTGTTGVAAMHTGRHSILIEANPDYATFAQQRLQKPEPQQTTVMPEPKAPPEHEAPTPKGKKR